MRMLLTRYALTRGRFELLVSRCSQYRKGEDRQAHRPVAVAMQQTISRVWVSASGYVLVGVCGASWISDPVLLLFY
jgi:hypothetical protein